jgi:5'-3' exoribonuclease 2
MLALATHEPYFKVLREDVFYQQSRDSGCRICGQIGHIAAQCTGQKKIKQDTHDVKSAPVEDKPFIFLDVATLREYLAVELDLRSPVVPFQLERAIDDWVFLIFFVGNDFLPHLPSLEIREGAIDTLLKIWKREFERMGGYVTNHGRVEMDRAQIILEALAADEDNIFQRRREGMFRVVGNVEMLRILTICVSMSYLSAEERQNPAMKRDRAGNSHRQQAGPPSGTMQAHEGSLVEVRGPAVKPIHHSLPIRPVSTVAGTGPAAGMPVIGQQGKLSLVGLPQPEDRTVVKKANMSAAETLRAKLAATGNDLVQDVASPVKSEEKDGDLADYDQEGEPAGDGTSPRGKKRKAGNDRPLAIPKTEDPDQLDEDDDAEEEAPPNPEADQPVSKKKLKKNPDGTVDYEDTVK